MSITFHSTPVLLRTIAADATGSINTSVSVPVGAVPGGHVIEATGAAPGGGTLVLDYDFQVISGASPHSQAPAGPIAFGGSALPAALGLVGLTAIVIGSGLVITGRRRRASTGGR